MLTGVISSEPSGPNVEEKVISRPDCEVGFLRVMIVSFCLSNSMEMGIFRVVVIRMHGNLVSKQYCLYCVYF